MSGIASTGSVFNPVFGAVFPTIPSGARESVAAHGLNRPTHERPALATNQDSRRSVGVATAARIARDGVTGSARSDRLHPSGHLACGTSDAGHRWRKVIPHITLPQLWRLA